MWLIYSILTVLFWGLWGLLVKLAARYLQWYQLYVLGNATALLLSTYFLLTHGREFAHLDRGMLYGLLAGVMGTLGYIFFILATKDGKVSIVVPLTATYPVITFILAVLLLGEGVSFRHVVGMVLAVVGAALLSF